MEVSPHALVSYLWWILIGICCECAWCGWTRPFILSIRWSLRFAPIVSLLYRFFSPPPGTHMKLLLLFSFLCALIFDVSLILDHRRRTRAQSWACRWQGVASWLKVLWIAHCCASLIWSTINNIPLADFLVSSCLFVSLHVDWLVVYLQ